jgi:hypothetical protein
LRGERAAEGRWQGNLSGDDQQRRKSGRKVPRYPPDPEVDLDEWFDDLDALDDVDAEIARLLGMDDPTPAKPGKLTFRTPDECAAEAQLVEFAITEAMFLRTALAILRVDTGRKAHGANARASVAMRAGATKRATVNGGAVERAPEAAPKPPRQGKAWTLDDRTQLERLWRGGAPIERIAARLGRSPSAIVSRLLLAGLVTAQDIAALREDRAR